MDWIRDSPHPDRTAGLTGQTVTRVAHVRNWDAAARTGLPYRWRIDGQVVGEGNVDLPCFFLDADRAPVDLDLRPARPEF